MAAQSQNYIIKQGYTVPNRNNGVKDPVLMVRTFKKGDVVQAIPYVPKDMPVGIKITPSILVDNSYLIPMSMVEPVPEPTAATRPQGASDELLTSVKNASKTAGFKKGALLGAGAGLVYGFVANKGVFACTLIGMIGGGVLGHFLIGRKARQEDIKQKAKQALGQVKAVIAEAPRMAENQINGVNMTTNRQ